MSAPVIHPAWERPPLGVTEGYSIEITARDVPALREAAHALPVDTPVAVTFLPGEAQPDRIAAAMAVRELGFEPMPHFSARRLVSAAEFEDYLGAVVERAGVRRCFVVAGDPPEPQGPFSDSMALLATGAFERNGIRAIGVGGHPEGHPAMSPDESWRVLATKVSDIAARGMAPLVVTQFGFDPDAVLAWLAEARNRGIDAPVRIGVPGPAGIKRLLAFAARCGVGASASVLRRYGISLGNLLGSAGPDRLIDAFATGLGEAHGRVRLHFYPFGGVGRTVEWIGDYERRHGMAPRA